MRAHLTAPGIAQTIDAASVTGGFFAPISRRLEEEHASLVWQVGRALAGEPARILGQSVRDRGLVRRTPISPLPWRSGTTANSWQVIAGREGSTRMGLPGARNRLQVPRPKPFQALTFSNETAAAVVLEIGAYPLQVRLGTYVPGRGYVIRSAGGFSKRAQGGIVRPALDNIRRQVR